MAIRVIAIPRVTWQMFREVGSIPDTTEEAQVNPELPAVSNIRPERTPGGKFRLPSFALNVRLNPADTLVVRGANKTDALLKHEQGHYDLLVLVARAWARELESLEAGSVAELGQQLAASQQTHADRATALDAEYDKQTDHSRKSDVQQQWDAAIAAALASPRADTIQNFQL